MKNLLTCCMVALIMHSATGQNICTSLQGGIGMGYVDANLWVPIIGPMAEVSVEFAPCQGAYPWKPLPMYIGTGISMLYAKSIGDERYGRSVSGTYLSVGIHAGGSYKKWSGNGGIVITTSKLTGSGPFFDPDIGKTIGATAELRYYLTPRLLLQGTVARHNCDLDGFVSEYSRYDRTWIYSIMIMYELKSEG